MIKANNKRITLTLSEQLIEQLEECCSIRGISKTNYIREILEKQVKKDIRDQDSLSDKCLASKLSSST